MNHFSKKSGQFEKQKKINPFYLKQAVQKSRFTDGGKRMSFKKFFLLASLCVSSLAYTNYTTYLNFEVIGGQRLTGITARMRSGFNAIDLSASFSPFDLPKSFKTYHARGLYLFYPKEYGIYLGSGAGVFNDPENKVKSKRTFEGVAGLQIGSKLFVQADFTVPLKEDERVTMENYKQYFRKSRMWIGFTVGLGF